MLSPPEGATQYSVRARYWHNFRGTSYWDDFSVYTTEALAIDDDITVNLVPDKFQLLSTFPNPFNPSVNIVFDLPKDGNVYLAIYDIMGRKVSTLINQKKSLGRHVVTWDARTKSGLELPSGMYFVQILLDNQNAQVQKITYMK